MKKIHKRLLAFTLAAAFLIASTFGVFAESVSRISNAPQFIIDKYKTNEPHSGMADAYTSLMYKFYNDIQGSVISDAIALDYPEYSYWAITYPYLTSNDNVAQCQAYLFIYKNPQIRYNNYGDPMVYDANRNWNGAYDIYCNSNNFYITWINSGPDITILERVENLGAGYNVHTWDYGKLAIFDSNLPDDILSTLYGYKIVTPTLEVPEKDYFPNWEPDNLDDDLPPNLEWLLDDTVFRDIDDLEVPPMPSLSESENILDYIKSFIPWVVQTIGNFLYWFSTSFGDVVYNIVHLPQAIAQYVYKIINIVYQAFQVFLKALLNKLIGAVAQAIGDLFKPTEDLANSRFEELRSLFKDKFAVVTAAASGFDFFTTVITGERVPPVYDFDIVIGGKTSHVTLDFDFLDDALPFSDGIIIAAAYYFMFRYIVKNFPSILGGVMGAEAAPKDDIKGGDDK